MSGEYLERYRKVSHWLPVLATAAALAIAGCGGGDSTSGGAEPTATAAAAQTTSSTAASGSTGSTGPRGFLNGGAAFVHDDIVPGLGQVVTENRLLTVYTFSRDRPGKSACYGACTLTWEPIPSPLEPVAREDVHQGKLSTFKRHDGLVQLSYAGHPLYVYRYDTYAAEANGNGARAFGGRWYAIRVNGEKAKPR